jgi:hypothetical protein
MAKYLFPRFFGWTLRSVAKGALQLTNGSEQQFLDCSRLILATERRPANQLQAQLRGHRVTVHVVGDAKEPRSYGNAIHEAAYLARRV